MFYEEYNHNGTWYYRTKPDGAWIEKKLQMAKGDEPKFASPHGHAIASHVTDKQLTKTPENITCDDLSNAHGHDANYWYTRHTLLKAKTDKELAEAVGIIEILLYVFDKNIPQNENHEKYIVTKAGRDFLAKIER